MPPSTTLSGEDGKSLKFWTEEQDAVLLKLIESGVKSNADIANAMKKVRVGLTPKAIERRKGDLRKVGKLNDRSTGRPTVENRLED